MLPLLWLIACGNPSGFRAKHMEFERVSGQNTAQTGVSAKPGDIVRQSGQIQFDQLNAVWEGEKVILKGSLRLAGQPHGEVTLTGTRNGDQISFSTDQKDLENKLKAQATCNSDDGVCSEYFIDMFAKDNRGVIQHDQFVLKKPETKSPQIAKPKASTTTSTTLTAPEPVSESMIMDEVQNPKSGGFVGASDDDARALFADEKSTTTTTTTSSPTTTTTLKVSPPPATSGAKSATTSTSTTSTTSSTVTTTTLAVMTASKEQASGRTDKGQLQNATDLAKIAMAEGSFFRFIWPANKTSFGTMDMAAIIQKMAKFVHEKISGYVLTVGDVSAQRGGKLFSHLSHQNGLDADISYLVNNKRSEFASVVTNQGVNSDFLPAENWDLFKYAFSVGRVELILVDTKVKKSLCQQAIRASDLKDAQDRGFAYEILRRVLLVKGHDNHFHLRIACPKTDRRCQQPVYSVRDSGCF